MTPPPPAPLSTRQTSFMGCQYIAIMQFAERPLARLCKFSEFCFPKRAGVVRLG